MVVAGVLAAAIDLMSDGRGDVPLSAVARQRGRLGTPDHRRHLAAWLEDIQRQAERPRCAVGPAPARGNGVARVVPMNRWSQMEAWRRSPLPPRHAALPPAPPSDLLDAGRHDDRALPRPAAAVRAGVCEIPLDVICATIEPGRAGQFDRQFRPAAAPGERWQRVWMAEQRGTVLPPISVVQVGDRYAVRDGHHRVRWPAPAARPRSTPSSTRPDAASRRSFDVEFAGPQPDNSTPAPMCAWLGRFGGLRPTRCADAARRGTAPHRRRRSPGGPRTCRGWSWAGWRSRPRRRRR